jgi:hypothetical protein
MMPFVETPGEMVKLLKTQRVLASEVQVGDIVLDQQGNQVAHVSEIKRVGPPEGSPPEVVEMFSFVEFANKDGVRLVATYDGYERSIAFRVGAEVTIVDRSCLRHLPGDPGDE